MGKNYGYRKYAKNTEEDGNKVLKIFLTSFFCMLVLFALIAKQFSPQVDVTIGNSFAEEEEEYNSRTSVDQRLRDIQEEDRESGIIDNVVNNSSEQANNAQSIWDKHKDEIVLDEKVNIPKFRTEALTPDNPFKATTAGKQTTTVKKDYMQPAQSQTYIYKVYIGYYTNVEQARVAQSILLDTNLGLNPFVKDIGNGNFSLQVGSFTNREKAQALVSQLLTSHFPARIIQE